MSRVEEIIKAEAEADRLQNETDAWHWLAAELIAAELDEGKSQRQLAREIGKSHQHVSRMVRCWHLKVTNPTQALDFNQVYNSPEVRGEPKDLQSVYDDPPRMTNTEAAQLIRNAEAAIPDSEKNWDDLRRANAILLRLRNRLRLGTDLGGFAALGTKQTFITLSDEIREML